MTDKRPSPIAEELGDALGIGHADLTDRVADAMRNVSRSYVESVVAALGHQGFAHLTVASLTLLVRLPERGIKVADLARGTGRTKQAAGKLIADLEQSGYVVRSPDPDDGRGFLVRPTEFGRKALSHGAAIKDDLAGRAIRVLGAEALERLYADLATLEDAFKDSLQ